MIKLIDPGFYSSFQDKGRFGFRHLGVPLSGPMDPKAFRFGKCPFTFNE